MSSAMDMNAKAVSLLQTNRNDEAIRYIHQGLKHVVTTVNESNNSTSISSSQQQHPSKRATTTTTTTTTTTASGTGTALNGIFRLVDVPDFDNTEMGYSPDCIFTVFNKAFILNGVSATDEDSCANADEFVVEHESLVSAVFLYNIGLAFQREGISSCNSNALRKALFFYETAYQCIEKCNDDERAEQQQQEAMPNYNNTGNTSKGSNRSNDDENDDYDDLLPLLKLAIINNFGHLHSTFFNVDAARYWRQKLAESLAATPLAKTKRCSQLDDDDLSVYRVFIDTIFFLPRGLQYAPSA